MSSTDRVFKTLPIERIQSIDMDDFMRDYYEPNRPLIVENACSHWPLGKRTLSDLVRKIGDVRSSCLVSRTRRTLYQNWDRSDWAEGVQPVDTHEEHELSFREFVGRVLGPAEHTPLAYENEGLYWISRIPLSLRDEITGGAFFELMAEDRPTFDQLWISVAGMITRLHYDNFNANFMFQVSGRKQVLLFDPGLDLYEFVTGPSARQSRIYDLENVDPKEYPNLAGAEGLEAILEPGNMLWQPFCWWHEYRTLDETSVGVTTMMSGKPTRLAAASIQTTVSALELMPAVQRAVMMRKFALRLSKLADEEDQ